MKYPIATLSKFDIFRANVYRVLKRPYLVVGLTAYTFVGILVTLYLMKDPVYTSNMELVLPGTGNSSSVSLNGIGQIVSKTDTPFAGGGFNPRMNYKEMLSSRRIVEGAAADLDISTKDFGKAKIKLTEQTSIILLTVKGATRDFAQAKASALYESLQRELDNLRADEVLRRDQSIQSTLKQYRTRMDVTREAIIDFQQSSMLVSHSQLEQLITTLASLKERKIYARADAEKLKSYVDQLSKELGVTPKLAGQAFALQSDVAFRAYSQELEKSLTKLTEYSSRWGIKHPKVIAQQKRLNLTRAAIDKRSRKLFGVKAAAIFSNLNLEATPKRSKLFADLIEAYANYKGQLSMLADLGRSIKALSINLKICSTEIIELENKQRKFHMAEALFTSAAARIEASRADIFASYPVIQMLASPSYPELHTSPNKIVALGAAIAGFLLITFGLFIIWQRARLIELLLKKS